MENRSVYRQVEEAALLGSFERGDHYHSKLSEQLRYRYREGRDLREIDIARLLAVSSLYGNKRADLDAGNKFVTDAMKDVRCRIPYFAKLLGSTKTDRDSAVSYFTRVMEAYDRLIASKGAKE